jgi:hypothetical protein
MKIATNIAKYMSGKLPSLVIWALMPLVYLRDSWQATVLFLCGVILYAIVAHLHRVEKVEQTKRNDEFQKLKEKVETLATLPVFLQGRK